MALTKINVTVENDPYSGGVKITSTANVESISGFDNIILHGRNAFSVTGVNTQWISYKKVDVTNVASLNFVYLDILAGSGKKYDYVITVKNGDTIVEQATFSNITCEFEGLFVGDFTTQYIAGSNFEYTCQKNTQVEYVNTLSGKYPHRVSNADTNYWTGTAKGLFLQLTGDRKKFVPDSNNSYTDSVVEYLSDGNSKILKTSDGHIWYVTIDGSVSKPFNDGYIGKNDIEFNWTEIGDLPTSGMVKVS